MKLRDRLLREETARLSIARETARPSIARRDSEAERLEKKASRGGSAGLVNKNLDRKRSHRPEGTRIKGAFLLRARWPEGKQKTRESAKDQKNQRVSRSQSRRPEGTKVRSELGMPEGQEAKSEACQKVGRPEARHARRPIYCASQKNRNHSIEDHFPNHRLHDRNGTPSTGDRLSPKS